MVVFGPGNYYYATSCSTLTLDPQHAALRHYFLGGGGGGDFVDVT